MTTLTAGTFSEFVQLYEHAALHFWARWNVYDAQMKSFLEAELPAGLRDLVAFGAIDIEPPEHHEICRQHKITNIPFLALYRSGTVTGLQKQKILEDLRQLIAND